MVKHPYVQLLSIHAFVKSGEYQKQVPLPFVLMSSRQKVDYENVLTTVKEIVDECQLEEIMVDFESAVWGAISKVFPQVVIKGCTFH